MAGNERTMTLRIAAEDAWSQTMNQLKAALLMLPADVLASMQKTSAAFSQLNIKGSLDIEAEKMRLLDAFNQIKLSGVASADDIKRAQVAYHEQMAKLDNQLKVTRGSHEELTDSVDKGRSSFLDLGSIVKGLVVSFGALSFADLIRQSVDSAIKMQALDVQFKTITGSSAASAESLRFVREESQRLGLVFVDSAESFAKFSASAKGTALEGDGARKVFVGVSEAITAMHLPAEISSRIFYQLQQMMSKNKVTAEDLNVVAESLPGTYTAVAQSMGLTVAEMMAQMKSGELLATDVLPKLAEQLHLVYGPGALEGAKSAQAAMNRFKNETTETAARIGQVLLPALTLFMGVGSGVAESIRWVIDVLGPGAPVMLAFAVAIGVVAIAEKYLTAAIIENTAAQLSNPTFLLIVGGAALVIGIAAGIKKIAESMGLVSAAAKNNEDPAVRLQREEAVAAKKKKILDDYEAAVGISLERQIAKQDDKYKNDILAVNAKYEADIAAAKGNAALIAEIEKKKTTDLRKVNLDDSQARQGIREKSAEDEKKFYVDSLKRAIEYGKATGNLTLADANEYKLALQKRLDDINAHFQAQLDAAKGNAAAVLAVELARDAAILKAKEQASKDAILLGLDNGQRAIEGTRASLDTEIKLIELQLARKEISATQAEQRLVAIEVNYARQKYENRLKYYNQVVAVYGKESVEARKSFKDLESAHKSYIDYSLSTYKAYADKIMSIDKDIKDLRLSIQEKIRDAQQKTMTSAQKYADDQKRVEEAFSKAREALAAKDFATAGKYNEQGIELAGRLLDKKSETTSKLEQLEKEHQDKLKEIAGQSGQKLNETDKENTEYQKKKVELIKEQQAATEGVENTTKALNVGQAIGVQILEEQKKATQENMDKLKEINQMTFADKSLKVVLDNAALSQVNAEIDRLTQTSVKEIVLKYVKSTGASGEDSFSNLIYGMATGGRVGGSGTGDNQLRLLDPREHVIRPEATAFWGDGLLSAFNSPWSAVGQFVASRLTDFSFPSFSPPVPSLAMATGGPVGNMTDMGTLNITVGGGSFPVMGKVDVLSELKTALRRESLVRQQ